MKLTVSIEYGYDEELPDITVEQVKKALQKFIVPSRSLHVYEAVEHQMQRTACTHPEKKLIQSRMIFRFSGRVPFMIGNSEGKTISQLWTESPVMNNLLPPGDAEFIEAEVTE